MRILARCHDRLLVETAPGRIAEVRESEVKLRGTDEVGSGLCAQDGEAVEANTATIHPVRCDHCPNFGPRAPVPGTGGIFQQFALQRSAPPWLGGREGWYCMGCSMPPR